ncbi:MAG: hypothetical protein RML46_01595 [Anaerolineae bacterium]|nr:hypothetical protein [Anaerolineae bacterium]MDW8067588.1 hypothetical protein [Anaerolineae bacterium]
MIWILDRHLVQRIRALARRERRRPADIVADALHLYEEKVAISPGAFLTAIAGLGASGQGDIAERSEEILRSETVPPYGWEPHGSPH